jgi:hypothetical protein
MFFQTQIYNHSPIFIKSFRSACMQNHKAFFILRLHKDSESRLTLIHLGLTSILSLCREAEVSSFFGAT